MVAVQLALFLLFLLLLSSGIAQQEPLPKGPFTIGYQIFSLPYFNADHSEDTIHLILNIWYPTQKESGARMRLLDYLHVHKRLNPSAQYNDFADGETERFKKFAEKNFGSVDPTRWNKLSQISTRSQPNAPFSSNDFPLIIGRLRPFSTTYTNEFLSSHGYVICMINGVENFPPTTALYTIGR